MDGGNFDDFTRNLAIGTSRRRVLRGLIGGVAALAGVKATDTVAAGKTTICHFPPDNPANVQIISVADPSLDSHFAHGDMVLGDCCVYGDCASTVGECGVLQDCLADPGSPSSCVYSDDSSMCGGGGDACTDQSFCLGTVCQPGATVDCSDLTDECNVGACDPVSGCYAVPGEPGGACNDGAGICSGGVCIPTCQQTATCDCSDTANAGLGCNGGEGVCQDGVCVPNCAATATCDCSVGEHEGLGCNDGEGICQDGVCVQTCAATLTCDCADGDNEGLGCNGGEGVCTDGVCVQTCAATSTCDCSDADNEGLGCDGGAGTCQDGECVANCGSISGQVTSSANGNPISGATVEVAGQTTSTDDDGGYSFACVPAGEQTVEANATGFNPGNKTVDVTSGDNVTANISLVPESTTDQITIVLTWNADPRDLDSHLTGPDVEHGGRFHVLWSHKDPVSYASLDVDDVTGSGPETVTVIERAADGAFVAGDYHYWVYNYSLGTLGEAGDFGISGATVTVSKDGVQQAQYDVGDASGSQAEFIWYVLNFTLAEDGTITLAPVQTMMNGSNDTVL